MGEMIAHGGNDMLAAPDEVSFPQLVVMGEQLVKTKFLPAHIQNGIQFAAIVLVGREKGLGTMASCQRLQFIKGTLSERADSQLSRFKAQGGRSEFKELTDERAVLWVRHPNGDQHTQTFTLQDAIKAGLATNDNYKKHPQAMLRSRAITSALKSVGWDGAVATYDPDELADVEPVREPIVVRTRATPQRHQEPTVVRIEKKTIPVEAGKQTLYEKALDKIRKVPFGDRDAMEGCLNRIDELRRSGEMTADDASKLIVFIDERMQDFGQTAAAIEEGA
jgi:hypothetical protein